MVGRPVYGQDLKPLEGEPAEDRLSLAEEELAYAAKSPTERVAVFLKIADRKMEAAKKLRKTGSIEEISFMPSRLLLCSSGGSHGSCLG